MPLEMRLPRYIFLQKLLLQDYSESTFWRFLVSLIICHLQGFFSGFTIIFSSPICFDVETETKIIWHLKVGECFVNK